MDRKPKKPEEGVIIVRTPKDCDMLENIVAALPQDKKGIIQTAKKVENIQVGPDEMLVMVDSGSFIHAINAN